MDSKVNEISPLVPVHYDTINVTYATTTDTYDYSYGGSIVGTVTVTYTDSGKTAISSVVRT